jgi:hypothetical protein
MPGGGNPIFFGKNRKEKEPHASARIPQMQFLAV